MENIEINLQFSDKGLEQITNDVGKLKKEINDVGKTGSQGVAGIDTNIKGLTSSFGSLSSVLKAAGGALAALGIADIGLKALQAADKFNILQQTLKRVSSGDADIAAQKFRELSAISNELGLKNTELIESYSKLAQRGFKPTGDEIKKLVDIAKAANLSVDQIAEAILDAQTGEFERLKSAGIKASAAGDQVSFTFAGVTKTVKNNADEINKAILSFGNLASIQGAAAGQANTLEAAQNRLSNATDSLLASIGNLGSGIASGFVSSIASLVKGIEDTLDPSKALNEAFASTYDSVLQTEKTVPKLTKRYDELKGKTKLTKTEQGEMNSLIEQLSVLYPQAVGELDKYGKALDINTAIIRSNNKEQRDRLLELTKLQVADLEIKQKQLKASEKQQDIDRKNGFILKESIQGAAATVVVTKEQINTTTALINAQKTKGDILKTNDELEKKRKLLAELEGGKEVTDFRKKEAEKTKAVVGATKEQEDARKKAAKKRADDLKELQKLIEKAADDAAKQGAKIGNTNEEIVLKQKALALLQLKEQEDEINKLAKQLGKKVDVTKEFGELRLVVEEEYIAKIREARQKDLLTAFGIEETLKPLQDSIKNIDFTKFKTQEAKSLAEALLDPKGFEAKFKEVNKAVRLGSEELSAQVRALVGTTNVAVERIANPLERLKVKLLKAFNIDDAQFAVIEKTFSDLTNSIFAFYDAQNQAAVRANEDLIRQYDERISIQEKALDTELQRQKEGSANNVEAEKIRLSQLQAERDAAEQKAKESREKALRLQLIQDGIKQVSNLITAGSEIFANFSEIPFVGVALGIAAVASMLLSFKALKTNAQGATKLRKGGKLVGAMHEQGGIDLGGGYEGENGEWVINTNTSKKQDSFLKRLNEGEFNGIDLNKFLSPQSPIFNYVDSARESSLLSDRLTSVSTAKLIEKAIAAQTDNLIRHDKRKPSFIPIANGYMEVVTNASGGKTIKKVVV